MLFVFQFSLCPYTALMFGMLLVTAVPDQCLLKVQTPVSSPTLQTAGKFTNILTFCMTVCYTKASAEFVLAIVNT